MLTTFLLFFLAIEEPQVYGEAVKESTPKVTIQALMAEPESYLDEVVKVEGTVKEVCPMKGCWVDIKDGDKEVRIKVKDGDIVFKEELVGKKVIAEGTVYKFDLTKEQAVGYFKHLAEEKGEAFDEKSITEGTTIYQIGGLGLQTK